MTRAAVFGIVLLRWRIDPDRFRLTPAACRSCQATGIPLACLFIDVDTMAADVNGVATVALVGRHELDAAAVLAHHPAGEPLGHPEQGAQSLSSPVAP